MVPADNLWPLSALEARVLAVLVEAERGGAAMAAPDLRTLTHACNRRRGTAPHVDHTETHVHRAVKRLNAHALIEIHGGVRETRDAGHLERVPRIPQQAIVLVIESRTRHTQRFTQRIAQHLEMSEQHLALLACLILGGPQDSRALSESAQSLRLHADPHAIQAHLDDMALPTASSAGALVALAAEGHRWTELLTRKRWAPPRSGRRAPVAPATRLEDGSGVRKPQPAASGADHGQLLRQIEDLHAKVAHLESVLGPENPRRGRR